MGSNSTGSSGHKSKNGRIMIEIKEAGDIVSKGWGEEVIIHNGNYCGKILSFHPGAKFSMHFHMQKSESWYIASGEFILRYIITNNAKEHKVHLFPGMIVNISPGDPHQLIAITEGDIFEVSTKHFDSDSYRIEKGDSQSEK